MQRMARFGLTGATQELETADDLRKLHRSEHTGKGGLLSRPGFAGGSNA